MFKLMLKYLWILIAKLVNLENIFAYLQANYALKYK